MRSLLCLVFLTFNASALEWVDTTIREDAMNFYYVGISSPKTSEKEALEEAYTSALNEAVRHNFGVIHNYMGQFSQTEKDIKVKHNTLLYRSGVKIIGAMPLRKKVIINDDDQYIAYREVSYPKVEVSIERERLKHVKTKKYELEPIKNEKKVSSQNKNDKESKKNKLSELPSVSFVYLPYAQTQKSAEFISLPFRLDMYLYKYLSIGLFYSYDQDEFEDEYNSDLKTIRSTNEFAIDLKIYPIRTKWVTLGIGVEHFSFEEEVELENSYQEEVLSKTKDEGSAKCAVLKIKLSQPSLESSGKSLYIDYRENKQRKLISAGISFDF